MTGATQPSGTRSRPARPFASRAVAAAALLSLASWPAQAGAQAAGASGGAEETVAAPPPGRDRSLATLFSDSATDFRRFASRDNTAWLVFGGSLALAAQGTDGNVTRRLATSGALEDALDAGQLLGGALFQAGSAVLTYAVGRAAGNPDVALVGRDLIRAQFVTQAVTNGVKLAVRRTRPDGTGLSFPSGHAAATFATATVLHRRLGWKLGLPAYALATYVAANRLAENRHYLSDVMFGATVGLVAGRTITLGSGRTRFALAPLAAPGGAGVALVQRPSR